MPLSDLMKQRLQTALNARRVAIVGATQHDHPVGMGPIGNLLSCSFGGEVIPVNPKYDQILGQKCYPDLESIDPPPELAILLLNQHLALEMAERAGRHGVQAVTIVSGGFKEVGADGEFMEEKLKGIAHMYQMPVIGPNTLGFSSFHQGLHGIFWHLKALPGSVAVITQSGGVGLTIANCLRSLECGLSHFIGAGNCSVVQISDYLDALAEDPEVNTFCLFMEGLEDPRGFYEVARTLALRKPIVAYKAGKRKEVSVATITHTGSLTGEYALYKAMFKQAGIIEAESTWEAAAASKALSMLTPPAGNRLCVLTFTAGPAIAAMDLLFEAGWEMPDLTPEVKRKIMSIIGEKTPVALRNPVDLTGPGFMPSTYGRALRELLVEPFDMYLLFWSYNPLLRVPIAEIEALREEFNKPMILVLLASEIEMRPALKMLSSRGICTYSTPEDAATALNALLARRRFLSHLHSATENPND